MISRLYLGFMAVKDFLISEFGLMFFIGIVVGVFVAKTSRGMLGLVKHVAVVIGVVILIVTVFSLVFTPDTAEAYIPFSPNNLFNDSNGSFDSNDSDVVGSSQQIHPEAEALGAVSLSKPLSSNIAVSI